MRHRRSYIAFAIAFVLHALMSLTAHASELESAVYTPVVSEDETIWHARWFLAGDEPIELRFAVPLPKGVEMLPARGVEAIVEADRIVGARVDKTKLPRRESGYPRDVHAAFRQRGAKGQLAVPFVDGPVVQILDTNGEGGARVEVEARAPFVRRVGYVAPDGVGKDRRQLARAITWFSGRGAVYARGDDVRAAGGIHGEALTKAQITRRAAVPVAVLFVAIVGGLLLVLRRVRHAAEVERADAVLARAIEDAG